MKLGKEIKIYGDLLFAHKPTIRSLVINYLYSKFVKREKHKLPVYRENATFVDKSLVLKDLEVATIAIVIDNEVVEIIRMQQRAAKFLMDDAADLVEFDPESILVKKGMKFNGETFVNEKD